MRVATVVGGLAVAAAAMFSAPAMVGPSHQTEVRATPSPQPQPQQQAPAPVENKAIREQRATGRVKYWRGVPAAIKNRAGGERAHRRWRKAKSSGRKAA